MTVSVAYLCFGGNIGDTEKIIVKSIARLAELRVETKQCSSFYRTAPWGNTRQAHHLNMCGRVETSHSPNKLLEVIHQVETEFGRTRKIKWGPRSLDIDIITYGDVVVSTPHLELPHPRALERAFVLVPLSEIAPHLDINGVSVSAAVSGLNKTGVEKLSRVE